MVRTPQAKRLGETDRDVVRLQVDGCDIEGLEGDTVLTAILLNAGRTSLDAFTQTAQAGFCLMGACQSCWVWMGDAQRVRACDTLIEEGMQVLTHSDGASL